MVAVVMNVYLWGFNILPSMGSALLWLQRHSSSSIPVHRALILSCFIFLMILSS